MVIELTTFEERGHVLVVNEETKACETTGMCEKCGAHIGSQASFMPCGDDFGVNVDRKASLRSGKHAWDYIWRGKVIGYVFRD
jgi:hypothetical protein